MTTNSRQVNGVVEAVGDKFSGSVKLNGTWYSFNKNYVGPKDLKGKSVVVTLDPWTFKDKTGENITAVNVLGEAPVVANDPIPAKAAKALEQKIDDHFKPRDFDAENRGKVRHGLMVALLPLVATDTITLEKAKEVVESVVPFVMGK